MSSKKKDSVPVAKIPFFRSESSSKEAKCKEFWKYLDSSDKLKPYEPPKFTGDPEGGVAATSGRSPVVQSSARARKPCSKEAKAKPKVNREFQPKKQTTDHYQFDKMFREGFKLSDFEENSPESLFAEIKQYERSLKKNCPVCKETKCTCDTTSDES